jgi:hypothetical protein
VGGWHDEARRRQARRNILELRARLDTTPHTHTKPVADCYRCELAHPEEGQ